VSTRPLAALRARAQAQVDALGVPARGMEAWKYTSTRTLTDTRWETRPCDTPREGGLPRAVAGLAYTDAMRGAESDAPETLGALVDLEPEHAGLWAMNTARFDHLAAMQIEAGAVHADPVAVRWHLDAQAGPAAAHPRMHVRVGANARVVLVEHFTDAGRAWQNSVSELEIGPGASVHYVRLQALGVDSVFTSALFARVDRDASLTTHDLVCGAALSRAEVHVQLAEPGAACALNGLYVLDGTRHADLYTRVHHQAPHTSSEELYKGALQDASRGAFTGSIVMKPGVRGASTRQENPNLLLGAEAHVDTRPQLEIFHSDVKAYHGATIGRLDPAALFYLRSRGLSPDAARRLLTAAFCNTVIDSVPVEAVRAYTHAWLEDALTEHAAP